MTNTMTNVTPDVVKEKAVTQCAGKPLAHPKPTPPISTSTTTMAAPGSEL
jgi:hypothetical protein